MAQSQRTMLASGFALAILVLGTSWIWIYNNIVWVNIVSKGPVRVDARQVWVDTGGRAWDEYPHPWSTLRDALDIYEKGRKSRHFEIVVTGPNGRFVTSTGYGFWASKEEAIDALRASSGWKDDFLFVRSNCGVSNHYRCETDHVFTLRNDSLTYVGSVVVSPVGVHGPPVGPSLDNEGYFHDVLGIGESAFVSLSRIQSPLIALRLRYLDGRFVVDLDKTWEANLPEWTTNVETIDALLRSPSGVDETDVLEPLAFNLLLSYYTNRGAELAQTLEVVETLQRKYSSEINYSSLDSLMEDYKQLSLDLSPGDLPDCTETADCPVPYGRN